MKRLEIERRFLLSPCSVKSLLRDLDVAYETFDLCQFYVHIDTEGVVRYRRAQNRFIRTRKRGEGLCREEEEREVEAAEFEKMLSEAVGSVILKRRYRFVYDDRVYELDKFFGPFKGLVILETEFASKEEAVRFELPKPLAARSLQEVTGKGIFSNARLARLGRIPVISQPLDRLLAPIMARREVLKASMDLSYHPYERAEHVIKAALFALYKSAEANRVAILRGTKDTERLHQFRVAVRKARSIYETFSHLFDPAWRHTRSKGLKTLMRPTSQARDLDVYLAMMPEYKKMVSDKHRAGLEALEAKLTQQARLAQKSAVAWLGSEEAIRELALWRAFCLKGASAGMAQAAEGPMVVAALKALKKALKRVRKRGRKIGRKSPAERLHALRIDVKRLRYMLEFFKPMTSPKSYEEITARLKALQTVLGDYQDLTVQAKRLEELAREEAPERMRKSVEALRGAMAKRAERKREEFFERFEAFDKEANKIKEALCKRSEALYTADSFDGL